MKTLKILLWNILAGRGVKKSSEKLFKGRIGVCRENKCGDYRKPLGCPALEKCNDCGCFLQIKNRIDEWYIECPKGYWK